MGKIYENILEEFFKKLSELDEFDDERVTRLRYLFATQKKPKPVAFEEVLSTDSKEAMS